MDSPQKSRSRRAEIRKNRPDASRADWQQLQAAGVPVSLGIAVAFFVLTAAVLLLRQDVVAYRPDQPITHDIVARVPFTFNDKARLAETQDRARAREPRVYQPNPDGDPWTALERDLKALPERASASAADVPPELKEIFDPGSVTLLRQAAAKDRAAYDESVASFVKSLRDYRNPATHLPLTLLDEGHRREDVRARREIRIGSETLDPTRAYSLADRDELRGIFRPLAEQYFSTTLQLKMVDYSLSRLQPTHVLDESATTQRRNEAAANISPDAGRRAYHANDVLVRRTRNKETLDYNDWQLLRAENAAYVSKIEGANWKPKLGVAFLALIVTTVLSAYVAFFQPRVVKNHVRAVAIAGLLLATLLLAALAGIGNGPIYLFGVAPTLLVAVILAIAYDRRFAIGVASLHGLLVTVALNQSAPFFMILWAGVLTA